MRGETALLAFGANVPGRFGMPTAAIGGALRRLVRRGFTVEAVSKTYTTAPLGPGPQPAYVNAAAVGHWPGGTLALLLAAKRIEREAGRRRGRVWGPRPLDIDIIMHGRRSVGWPVRARHEGRLTVPHPHASERSFVITPLLEIAASWRHPISGLRPAELAKRLKPIKGRRNRPRTRPHRAQS
ncbi:MAG TPA: 2-amino-4-hydroxy-6-hydroxymethyldihydropteridine diphosphokinase [Hyphomicrobiaceae bacterium]|nr:2-amino-4-hydroxy-6-hydroxymethyldihydropteridine diphosphokinase [Hyphomicrobiaceae bacterium]